jgi:hypothetical protein
MDAIGFNTAVSVTKTVVANAMGVAYGPGAKAFTEFALGHPTMLTQLGAMGEKNELGTLQPSDYATLAKVVVDIGIAVVIIGGAPISVPVAVLWTLTGVTLSLYQNRENIESFLGDLQNLLNSGAPDLGGDPFTGMPWPGTQDPSDIIESLQTIFTQAEKTRSPLILDLDGLNGVETLSKTAGIHFDHDGNKFAEQTGWVGKNDGMLVWDRNGNGQIDNGTELFGNNTVLKNGSKADNGFTALADLDFNKDGKVDANDAASSQLRVFKDANSNGVVDAGELMTLAQAGVKSLSTGYTSQATTDANGNQHLQAGSFTTTSGQNRAMDDVWFAVDTARTVDTDLVAINSTIDALPDWAGFGDVHSLHQAMARDASGKLQALV